MSPKSTGTRKKQPSEQPAASDRATAGSKKTAQARRKFILKQAKAFGRVTYAEIRNAGFKALGQSLMEDGKWFDEWDLGIKKLEGEFVYAATPAASTYDLRKEANKDEKRAIGRLATEILWGSDGEKRIEEVQRSIMKDLNIYMNYVNKKEIVGDAANKVRKTQAFLGDYWKKSHRIGCLDAGTTTTAVALCLEKEEVGSTRRTSTLRLLTNCPKIEDILTPSNKFVNVIGLGGSLRKDTVAHAGELTLKCLRAWDIHFDVSLIGTTSLAMSDGDFPRSFMCDSEDEALVKSALLSNGELRCILMDSSKCLKRSSSSFLFAQADSASVDVVITDSGLLAEGLTRKTWFGLWQAGIVVLVARTGKKDADALVDRFFSQDEIFSGATEADSRGAYL